MPYNVLIKDISRIRDYGVAMEHKAVKRNLSNLQQAGFGLGCDETVRVKAGGEEEM